MNVQAASVPGQHVSRARILRASAGTGKTYQLTNEYLRLLLSGVPCESILACTFTRKAAGEILERILLRLSQAVLQETQRQELARALGLNLTTPQLERTFADVVAHLHRVRIMTLDAFFAQLARAAALEVGLPLGWTIIDDSLDQLLRRQALSALLTRDDSQYVERLVVLLHQEQSPRSVAGSLQLLVDNLYHIYRETTPEAWQLPSVGQRLSQDSLQKIRERLAEYDFADNRFNRARDANLRHLQSEQWEDFVSSGLAAKILSGETTYYRKPIPDDVLSMYEKLLRHAQAVITDRWNAQTRATYELLRRFDEHYRRLKDEAHAVLFDDVTYALTESLPGDAMSYLPFRLDGGVDYVLVDEFQDTSPPQWRVIEPFADHAVQKPTGGAFWCVGDVKQAIYAWRGGRADIFDEVAGRWENLTADSLTKSYRSSPVIIETVNQLFHQLKKISQEVWQEYDFPDAMYEAISQWTRGFETHSTAREGLPGYFKLEVAEAVEQQESSVQEEDEDVTTRATPAQERAADVVAHWYREAPGRSIAVLTRTNQALATMIYLLRKRGIPASEEGGNPVTDSVPVTTVLSLLRMADNPGDLPSRYHVAKSPLGESLNYVDWRNDEEALRLAERVRRQLVQVGYGGYLQQLVGPVLPHVSERDASRLQQLVEFGYRYPMQSSLRPREFVDWVAQQRAADPRDVHVRVTTIHQAKGLEFDIVVLPELHFEITGRPPPCVVHRPAPGQPIDRVCIYRRQALHALLPEEYQQMFAQNVRERTNEALCLLYVAMTRAVHVLHIVAQPTKSEKIPRSPLGLLQIALNEGKPLTAGTTVMEMGDPEWFRQVPVRATQPTVRPRPSIQFRHTSRAIVYTTPSALERGAQATVRELVALENTRERVRGRVLHALFEQVGWWEDFTWDEETLRAIACRALSGAAASLSQDELLNEFRRALFDEGIQAALSQRRYEDTPWTDTALRGKETLSWRVYTERPILAQRGEQLLHGVMDRLVLGSAGSQVVAAEVIDFKTDRCRPDDSSRLRMLVDIYRPQLVSYRDAVSSMYSLAPEAIRMTLIFVDALKVVEVQNAL